MGKNIYRNLYDNKKNLGSLEENPRIIKMVEIIGKLNLNGKNILDIGCHDGALLSMIKNRQNNFYGVDANEWAVSKAREKNIDTKQFFFNDSESLPFEDNFFDMIIAGEILEHIYDTDFFMKEIDRILKPSGKLLISTPNVASLGRRLLLFFGVSPLIEISPNEKDSCGHIRYFTFKTLEDFLKKHHFQILFETSDVINFSSRGKPRIKLSGRVFRNIGQSIICLCEKN
ncbi:MAG: class I SAM-dependent methyltransferase [bacterium]|nr:class I SAM-dependent methyltransferase [bacterium]